MKKNYTEPEIEFIQYDVDAILTSGGAFIPGFDIEDEEENGVHNEWK